MKYTMRKYFFDLLVVRDHSECILDCSQHNVINARRSLNSAFVVNQLKKIITIYTKKKDIGGVFRRKILLKGE